MTNEEKRDLEEELENLKLILEFHSIRQVIKDPKELESHIDAILDRMNEIKKLLKNE
ncbi:MAG: hypothetical protein ACLTSL_06090 [Odoribacter splanchnicus]